MFLVHPYTPEYHYIQCQGKMRKEPDIFHASQWHRTWGWGVTSGVPSMAPQCLQRPPLVNFKLTTNLSIKFALLPLSYLLIHLVLVIISDLESVRIEVGSSSL